MNLSVTATNSEVSLEDSSKQMMFPIPKIFPGCPKDGATHVTRLT